MANEYLQRTPTSTGNRKVWTWSGWVKRNNFNSSTTTIFSAATSGNDQGRIAFTSSAGGAGYYIDDYTSGATQLAIDTSAGVKSRDFSSWMNLVVVVDTTKTTEDNRAKIYINGALYAGPFSSEIYTGGINYNTRFNQTIEHTIGWLTAGGSGYNYLGQFTDIFFIDGQALTPDVFGFYKVGKGYISVGSTQSTDFRPGQWVPKTPRVIKTAINNNGGFGVNGFYLPMNDSNNFGADFHCEPNSIIKLQENLPQPKCRIDGVGDYTGALRNDPFKQYLVLALPFVSGGLQSGFGDYSAAIKGSGTQKTTTTNTLSIASTACYYGSSAFMNGTNYGSSGNPVLTFASNADFNFGSSSYTIECWINPTASSQDAGVVVIGDSGAQTAITYTNGVIKFRGPSGSVEISSPTYSQINQWFHTAIVRETGSIIKLYVNGVCVGIKTNFTSTLSQDKLNVGSWTESGNYGFTGYLQDLRIYKGVAKYTGGFDVPRPYTPVGIATWRAVPDSPANNFATLNPLVPSSFSSGDRSISNGNLSVTTISTGNGTNARSTIGVSTGKWYAETYVNGIYGFLCVKGIGREDNQLLGSGGDSIHYWAHNGNKYDYNNGTQTISSYGSTYTTGDIIGISINGDNGEVIFYKNGVSQGIAKTFPSSQYPLFIQIEDGASAVTMTFHTNFGQNPTFSGNTTTGTYADTNGKGLFKYQPPSGFLALCEDNLPTPAIANPGKYFKTVLYTGDGADGRNIVGVGFTPDLVWLKGRNNASWGHFVQDSVRGANIFLKPNETIVEGVTSPNIVSSFGADGFTINANGNSNNSGDTYVAWCWRAGAGTTSTNTNGSITSVVSVNQDAGFSIVSYTGNATVGATVGHGLNKAPSMVIIKNRSEVRSWIVYHRSASPTPNPLNATNFALGSLSSGCLSLNLTNGTFAYSMDGQTNGSGSSHIAYCWAEIEGYSKFGSYVGNGNADGPFVYCGFKPAWVMIKRTDSTQNWPIIDSSRDSVNVANRRLFANLSDIEDLGIPNFVDLLSNGFKCRDSNVSYNASGGTYIFAAYAESPFQTANAK
jgi:hypothetical protein